MSLSSSHDTISVLYSDHHSWLNRWLRSKLDNESDAADIAQDTFVRLLRKPDPQKIEDKEPRALITHIAKNLVIDHWRRKDIERAYLATISALPAAESPSEETKWLIVDVLQCVDSMLRNMPEKTRNIFVLAQIKGYKYKQIAEQLGYSIPTVKRHMKKAYIALLSIEN
ncbi:MAG: sigma-70 family RNA polymerase sigma factor [Pseudomonadota bacterium]